MSLVTLNEFAREIGRSYDWTRANHSAFGGHVKPQGVVRIRSATARLYIRDELAAFFLEHFNLEAMPPEERLARRLAAPKKKPREFVDEYHKPPMLEFPDNKVPNYLWRNNSLEIRKFLLTNRSIALYNVFPYRGLL